MLDSSNSSPLSEVINIGHEEKIHLPINLKHFSNILSSLYLEKNNYCDRRKYYVALENI